MLSSCPYHSFDVSFQEATRIQSELRHCVVTDGSAIDPCSLERVGGVDVAFLQRSYNASSKTQTDSREDLVSGERRNRSLSRRDVCAVAGLVVIDVKRWCITETVFATAPVLFPYVPGFLSFREGPAVLKAIGELSAIPDVILFDGCGIAHPRGLGLASHMSLLCGIPSVGCAKSKLCGVCETPSMSKGSWTPLIIDEKVVGACVRTRDNVRPVYVSPGNGMDVDSARRIVEHLAVGYRLPEPTRLAHQVVTARKKELKSSRLAW